MPKTNHVSQLFIYGALGLIGTLCHYSVLFLLVELSGYSILLSSSAGFMAGAIVNHELNRRYLFFKTERSYGSSAIRFFSVAAAGFFVNLSTMSVLISVLTVHYLFAQVIATVLVFLITFLLNKFWTFQT